jgi:hypothetical protein
MPVFSPNGDLIGVTQLVNKKNTLELRKSPLIEGTYVLACFRASFDESDQKSMQIFNNQAGAIS